MGRQDDLIRFRNVMFREEKDGTMLWDGLGLAFIERGDDFGDCVGVLAEPYQHEFAIHPVIAPEVVENAAVAGFMPMAMMIDAGQGRRAFLTPKLHHERCLLDPRDTHATRTALRESRRYGLSLNRAFDEVLSVCVATHGDGWLLPELVEAIRMLHYGREVRQLAFISMELWSYPTPSPMLVAGEIGYVIGSAYASLTGFSRVSGAGTVQLAATGAAIAAAGITVWDLGMEIGYKRAVGARVYPRLQFLTILEQAYLAVDASIRGSMLPVSEMMPARGLLEGLEAGVDS